jgi:hypothetical protein
VVSRWCFTLHRWPEPRMYLSIHEALHPTSPRLAMSADDMSHRPRMPFWDHACDDLATAGRDAPASQVVHGIVGRLRLWRVPQQRDAFDRDGGLLGRPTRGGPTTAHRSYLGRARCNLAPSAGRPAVDSPLRGIRQRTSRKLFLDFQDMYRLHGAPLLLPSCGRTGSLGPVIGPTVSQAGRYSRDYYGASALLCPIT